MGHSYSGFGLLIQPVKNGVTGSPLDGAVDTDAINFYSRIGAFKFSQLSQEDWGQVRLSCGSDADTELTVECGSCFELL
jgi:hypothetical protein